MAGLHVKTISTRVFIKQDGALNYTAHAALSFHEDCVHASGQNTLLDIIYDLDRCQ